MRIIFDFVRQDLWLASLVNFILGFITEWVWCRWMVNVNNNNRFYAANWSVLTGMLGLVGAVSLVAGEWIPLVTLYVGYYLGTFFAVKKKVIE